MKPGSPLLCGVYQGKLLICLSGNPFAALACFEVFAVPVLRRLAGEEHVELRRAQGVLEGDFPKESKGRRLIRARMEGERVTLTGDNHSQRIPGNHDRLQLPDRYSRGYRTAPRGRPGWR